MSWAHDLPALNFPLKAVAFAQNFKRKEITGYNFAFEWLNKVMLVAHVLCASQKETDETKTD